MRNSENDLTVKAASLLLRDLLQAAGDVKWVDESPRPTVGGQTFDAAITITTPAGRVKLLVDVKRSGVLGTIQQFAGAVALARPRSDMIAVLVAPFVSERGREACKRLGLGFMDVAGNAYIRGPGLLIERWGQGARAAEAHVLKHLFTRKSTWVIRALLTEPSREWTLTALSDGSRVSLGQTKKVVDRLSDEGYAAKRRGATRLTDAGGLLERWAAEYKSDTLDAEGFFCPIKGQAKILDALTSAPPSAYALTLGAASSLVAPFVRSTDVYLYVTGDRQPLMQALDLSTVEFGGNVYLAMPSDDSVLIGSRAVKGLTVVSDLQLYLDLYNYPARGREQAERVREQQLGI
jgi:DNA-binding MarR family transcriptional regulator